MITFIIIVLALLWISSIVIYIKKKKWFEKHKGIAEFSAVIVSLIFTLVALNQTQSSIDQSTSDFVSLLNRIDAIVDQVDSASNSIGSLKLSMVTLPIEVDSFAYSISNLNQTIQKQEISLSKSIHELNVTSSDLNSSLNLYKNSISDYSEQLNQIVTATDSQLVIWKDQQRIMLKEMSRKPQLKIAPNKIIITDSSFIIKDVAIINNGNINCEIERIKFILLKDELIKINVFGSQEFESTEKSLEYIIHFDSEVYSSYVIPANDRTVLRGEIELKKKYLNNFSIPFSISYVSKYEDGILNTTLVNRQID